MKPPKALNIITILKTITELGFYIWDGVKKRKKKKTNNYEKQKEAQQA